MPVEYVHDISSSTDQRSLQYSIQNAAVTGAIDFIEVNDVGEPYTYAIPAQSINQVVSDAATGATSIQIGGNSISTILNAHQGYVIRIESGRGEGQQRRITSYTYSVPYGICYFDDPLDFAVDAVAGGSGSFYSILPYVKIEGDGTQNSNVYNTALVEAEATARINSNRVVTSIEMVDPGKDYTYATVTVEPLDPTKSYSSSDGTTANSTIARAIMSPEGGHGSNPVKELGASNIMIFMELSSDESGEFPINNDYRQFALIANPQLRLPQQRLRLWETSTTGQYVVGATGYVNNDPGVYGTIERWISSSITGNSEIWMTNVTGGTFGVGLTFSSGTVDKRILENDIRTVAGTEGYMCKQLHLISSQGSTYDFASDGSDFYINDYVMGNGNTANNLGATRAFGEIVSWDLSSGSNRSGDLLVDKTNDNFVIGEDVGSLDRDFTTSVTAVGEVTKISETELYTPAAYSQLWKFSLDYNGVDGLTWSDFSEDQLVLGMSGGTAVGATSLWEGYVVEYQYADDGTTGFLTVVGVEGTVETGQSFNNYNSINSEYELVATISDIVQKNELKYRTGNMYYIQNVNLISRNRDQVEEIKIIIGS